ncbi:MAG TPA: hypothetical protein VE954_13555 [Oligoflexus sp.]|uniref:hypothetical protein n=1 Tax=Oligoflexus sp. TaxID=1971216 RepID=UPI002D4AEAAA|nr:hypothetical protein [Oligoflexus sp.]HYX34129.1 hypothetical protein [Oligoflexus sp.]
MAEFQEERLTGFNMVYGVAVDLIYAKALKNVTILRAGRGPYFLQSAAQFKNDASGKVEEKYEAFREIVGAESCKDFQIWDSGGFSIWTSTLYPADLSPESIGTYYRRYPCALGIGADAPIYNSGFEMMLKVGMPLTKRFHRAFKKPRGMLHYEPIHGLFADDDGNFTLAQKKRWVEEVRNVVGDSADGWAMRLPYELGSVVNAYFAMFPLSYGMENFHVLGTARLELLCLFVYLAQAYKRLSVDATNFTIQAVENPMVHRFVNGRPKSFPLKGKTDVEVIARELANCQGFNGEPCEICAFMSCKLGKTFGEAFRGFRMVRYARVTDKKKVITKQFNEWLLTHNIAVVERFVDELKALVHDRAAFFQFLERIKMGSVVAAITGIVDPVLASDREAYAQHLSLLG